jgi:LPXTG-site transpeptidase (sortase) family protein
MKFPKIHDTKVFLSVISLIVGIVVYLGIGRQTNIKLDLFPPSFSSSISIRVPPTAINIQKIGKNLPIKPAIIHGNDWELFDDAVAWLSTSAAPGEGNVILYAHDWRSLWVDLYLLKPGDIIEVQQNNIWKKYKVTQSLAIDQHDTQSILSNENRLTLYTCEGSFDKKRRVVYATPID